MSDFTRRVRRVGQVTTEPMTLLCLECGSSRHGQIDYRTGKWRCDQCHTTRNLNTGVDERKAMP